MWPMDINSHNFMPREQYRKLPTTNYVFLIMTVIDNLTKWSIKTLLFRELFERFFTS